MTVPPAVVRYASDRRGLLLALIESNRDELATTAKGPHTAALRARLARAIAGYERDLANLDATAAVAPVAPSKP
jgi:hypothetical protein